MNTKNVLIVASIVIFGLAAFNISLGGIVLVPVGLCLLAASQLAK